MCRLLGWVARQPITAREALGDDSLAAFRKLAQLHADGWGIAYDGVDSPIVERSTRRADTDPAFTKATNVTPTRVGIIHLRWATPGLPVELRNTHPFQHGPYVFAHNGSIKPAKDLDDILTPRWQGQLHGTTDSERYFLAILAELDRNGTDVPTAATRVATRLTREFQPSSLNALLGTPTALYVINCHDPATAPYATPISPGSIAESVAVDHATYHDLHYRVTSDAVVVASSGFITPEVDGWQMLPNDTILVIDRDTLATRQIHMGSGLGTTTTVATRRRPDNIQKDS